jgi:glycosyltransferase involved in cell wall biosynthesis
MIRSTPIAAVTQSLNVGGSTTFLLNLGAALRARGEQLPVVCLNETNEMAADFAAAEVPVFSVARRRYIYEDRTLAAYRHLATLRPRAVLACLGAESFEVLRVLPPGVARLGIIQSDDPGPYTLVDAYRPWLDTMIGVSPTIHEKLVTNKCFARSVCIPYGIQFRPATERKQRKAGEPLRLIYVGRVVECQKRVSRLVELARRLAAQALPFHFTFVGGGPELVATRAALANLPQVELLGDVPNQRVPELLRASDVFVLLSDFEGLPLSLLEAMGEGVVPVASDLESGIRNIITDNTGVRVAVGDVAAAAAAIAALARDPARLEALSRNAARLVREEYNATQMAEKFLALVETFPSAFPDWPEEVVVPQPQLVRHGWLYEGLPRLGRRWLKQLV